MNKVLVLSLLLLPGAAAAQTADYGPGVRDPRAEALDAAEPVQRPDARRLLSEISAELKLSTKQEERITSAVDKKTAEFDKLMKEYERNSAEEKKWRAKMYENRHDLIKINRDMPDLVRDMLDDEQRPTLDNMLEARRRPAPAAASAKSGSWLKLLRSWPFTPCQLYTDS